jgi:integrase
MTTTTAITKLPKFSGFDQQTIDRSDLQPSTKYKYTRELERMILAGVNPFDFDTLTTYANTLRPSSKAFLKAALRLTTKGYEQKIKGQATPENIGRAQAAIMRLDAMRGSVQVRKITGTKAHTWLSSKQVEQITKLCKRDLEGRRDWIVLGLLLGAGLRRDELATLTCDALKQQPTKDGIRYVLEVKGKGAKTRVIPIKSLLAKRLREWCNFVEGGLIVRSLGMGKKLGESMSAVAIFGLVRKYGKMIDLPDLAPHDLRRTYAQLGYQSGVPLTQISVLLGHSSVETTKRYLNLNLDLETTVSDFIPLSGR